MTVHKFYLLKFTSDIINFSTTIHNAIRQVLRGNQIGDSRLYKHSV